MPIYEYQCQSCGHHLEEIQKFSDPALIDCTACGKPKLEKLVSHTSFQLKGGGWYVTDIRDKDKKPEKKPAGSSSEKTAEKPAAEKEKPAATEAAPPTKEPSKKDS